MIRLMDLGLSVDEVLSTTRAVRRRLDLERPVEREVLEECLRLAQQAPTAGYRENWHFVLVTDPKLKRGVAELYGRAARPYLEARQRENPERDFGDGFRFMDHLHEVPVLVIPCIEGRGESLPFIWQASHYGSIMQAAWSFMLAARSRGLGGVWTTLHLEHERDAAELLGIPSDEVMQVALIPLAYTIGTSFKPARRKPLETMVHWDRW
jgi:nitroreductase